MICTVRSVRLYRGPARRASIPPTAVSAAMDPIFTRALAPPDGTHAVRLALADAVLAEYDPHAATRERA